MGVDQIGLHPADQLLQRLHVLLGIGAVGHAVYLQDLDPGLLQGGLEQGVPGDGHQGLEGVPVGIAQVVQNDPARAADVGVTDDV